MAKSRRPNKLRVVLIDDEPLAIQHLRLMLEEHKDVQVVAECVTGKEALRKIRSTRPDVIFLDIQMPEMDGFEVLRKLDRNVLPSVVFVTAYDQYAVKAFEQNAVDYLLKPYDHKRLRQTVQKIRSSATSGDDAVSRVLDAITAMKRKPPYALRIAVKNKSEISFVKTEDISWIEAQGDYVCLHTKTGNHIVHGRLKQFEADLDPNTFVRIHRSAIVNVHFVKGLRPLFHRDVSVLLTDGQKLTLSRTYRKFAFERMRVGVTSPVD